MSGIVNIFSIIIICYFILINLSYLLLFLVSYYGIRRYNKKKKLTKYLMVYQSSLTPPISLIVPSYNEELTIINNIYTFMNGFDYPEYEVIVVNDGSKDKTLELVLGEFECEIYDYPFKKEINSSPVKNIYKSTIYENLFVVDKINGGKADALNAGINVARYPYFGSIDADTILEKDSYLKVVMPIINNPKRVIATGGIVGVINGCEYEKNKINKVKFPDDILAGFQLVEYLRAFLFGRYAWTLVNALPLISGAFGLFQKKAVIEVGGYSSKRTSKSTVGEDMELVIKLHKYFMQKKIDYSIEFVPDPLSWTEVPEDYKTLRNQRARWHRGLMETLFNNMDIMFNPKYKNMGMLSFPYYFIFELLAPVIELSGYTLLPIFYFLKLIDKEVFILFFLVAVLLGVLVSMFSVFLEIMTFRRYKSFIDTTKLLIFAILENLGYRQMTLFFRLKGFIQYFKKDEKWGEMKRKGAKKSEEKN